MRTAKLIRPMNPHPLRKAILKVSDIYTKPARTHRGEAGKGVVAHKKRKAGKRESCERGKREEGETVQVLMPVQNVNIVIERERQVDGGKRTKATRIGQEGKD